MKVLSFSTTGWSEFTYRSYRIQLENMSILSEWLVLYPLRCYFSVGFTQLKGRNQKFNLYPLGVIFLGLRQSFNPKPQMSVISQHLCKTDTCRRNDVTNCPKRVHTKTKFKYELQEYILTLLQSDTGLYLRDFFFYLHFQSLLILCVLLII